MNSQLVTAIINCAKVNEEELEEWNDYNHPVRDSYGRKLVYKENFFELMVMSWVEGDFSAIHDHGCTQWGAVQVFGEAEHAIFSLESDFLTISSCQKVDPGTILPVDGDLIHQMGNRTKTKFLSLHVYGLFTPSGSNNESVTGNARIFNVTEGCIERTNGGVFYGLPQTQINAIKLGLQSDYISWLRNTTEYIQRIQKVNQHESTKASEVIEKKIGQLFFDIKHWQSLQQEVKLCLNKDGEVIKPRHFQLLHSEIRKLLNLVGRAEGVAAVYNAIDSLNLLDYPASKT